MPALFAERNGHELHELQRNLYGPHCGAGFKLKLHRAFLCVRDSDYNHKPFCFKINFTSTFILYTDTTWLYAIFIRIAGKSKANKNEGITAEVTYKCFHEENTSRSQQLTASY